MVQASESARNKITEKWLPDMVKGFELVCSGKSVDPARCQQVEGDENAHHDGDGVNGFHDKSSFLAPREAGLALRGTANPGK